MIVGNCFGRRAESDSENTESVKSETTTQLEGHDDAGTSVKTESTKSNTRSSDDEKPMPFRRQKQTVTELKKRSGSMQQFWANEWDKMIGDRTSTDMANEAGQTECGKPLGECNCVQRAIVVMKIYKFWNDRKHIVESAESVIHFRPTLCIQTVSTLYTLRHSISLSVCGRA